jgi:Zn-dependent peptidase ImmA (M78 family)
MSALPAYRRGELAAEALRNELDYGSRPIDNLWRAIRRDLDLDLAFHGFTQQGGDGLYHWDGRRGLIVINKANRPARQRFTGAHEIGHHFMHRPEGNAAFLIADQNVYETGGEEQEVEANSFAACFLAPTAALRREVEGKDPDQFRVDDIIPLMAIYGLSCESLIYRLKNIDFLRQADMNRLLHEAKGQVTTLLELYGHDEDALVPHGSDLPQGYVRIVVEMYRNQAISEGRLATLLRVSKTRARELARSLPSEESSVSADVREILDEVEAEGPDELDEEEETRERELAQAN